MVVQYSESVQTAADEVYNLTCTLTEPGEAVVSSDIVGAGEAKADSTVPVHTSCICNVT